MQHDSERYDTLPYEASAYAWTHPDQLGSVGALFGLDTAPCNQARVLEVGCATGGNLVPMAAHLPGSTFVGVDPSGVQLEQARDWARRLGLDNLRLVQAPLEDLGDEGPFDYVIAHGLYSWVPPSTREALLALCDRVLTPHGVAYISFNTNPGWTLRSPVRTLLQHHTRGLEPAAQIARARELVALLVEAQGQRSSAWAALLRSLGDLSDQAIFHDFLSPHCEPFFLEEFTGHLSPHGLRYLCEAEPAHSWLAAYPEEIQGRVRAWGGEEVHDWVRGTTFRRALVCRQGAPVRQPEARHLEQMYLSSHLAEAEAKQPGERAFKGSHATVRTSHPLTIAALEVLRDEEWVHFDVMWQRAVAAAGPGDEAQRQVMAQQLWAWFQLDELRVHRRPRPWTLVPPERPRASDCARGQAPRGVAVNPQHQPVALDRFEIHLLQLLDGTRHRDDLVESLVEVALGGGLSVTHEGEPVRDRTTLELAFRAGVEEKLRALARAGFFET